MGNRSVLLFVVGFIVLAFGSAMGQPPPEAKPKVHTVTIPISIFSKRELKENFAQEYLQTDRIIVKENGEEQEILSIRSVTDSPMSLAFIIQDDLTSNFNLQIKEIKEFILGLPRGTRVMVAYARSGSLEVRQRFTDDLERAAASMRIVASSDISAPRSPFDPVADVLSRFDAIPAGRRAILLFSDGVDTSGGANLASITQSFELDRSILKAQRKSVAIYSFFSPTVNSERGNSTFPLAGQGALAKLADETGGRSFYQGSGPPVSYLPFLKELSLSLRRQFSLTYLSTHMKKTYYKINVTSTNPEIKIEHPRGYYYR